MVETSHSRYAGMTKHRHELNAGIPQNLPPFTLRPALLGRLFPTRLYHGSAELAERPTSL